VVRPNGSYPGPRWRSAVPRPREVCAFGMLREHWAPSGWVGQGRRSWLVELVAHPWPVEKKQVTRDESTARTAPGLERL